MRKESGHGSATSPAEQSEAPKEEKEKVTMAQVGSDGKVKFGEQ